MNPVGLQLLGLLAGVLLVGAIQGAGTVAQSPVRAPDCLPETPNMKPETVADDARKPTIRFARVALPSPPADPAPPRPLPRPLGKATARPEVGPLVVAARSKAPVVTRTTELPPRVSEDKRRIDVAGRSKPVKQRSRFEALDPVRVGPEQQRAGRPLLRLLEHGQGPAVEIAWPEHSVARNRLHDLLRRCHGLRTALLRDQEILLSTGPGDQDQVVFDGDRHSGFLRTIDGALPSAEAGLVDALKARHGAADVVPIRLLSRRFDARLLGGLRHIVGPDYRRAKAVTARYAVAGGLVLISGIEVDGVSYDGRIEIGPGETCRAERAG